VIFARLKKVRGPSRKNVIEIRPPTDDDSKFGDLVAISSTSRVMRIIFRAALQLHFRQVSAKRLTNEEL